MDRQLVRQVTALGDLDGVNLTYQVGDGNVRRSELLAVTLVAADPLDLEVVAFLLNAHAARSRDRLEGVFVELAAGDDRDRLVEKAGQAADHARLRLPALAEEDNVLAAEDRVFELRHNRLF